MAYENWERIERMIDGALSSLSDQVAISLSELAEKFEERLGGFEERLTNLERQNMTEHHRHPITVEVTVPTPEALHELSIFLQEFTRKHHGHHASFAAEVGSAPAHHAVPATHHAAPATHQHTTHALPGMAPVASAAIPAVSFQDIVNLQSHLINSRILDPNGIAKIYADLGHDLANPLPEHLYGTVHARLHAHLPK